MTATTTIAMISLFSAIITIAPLQQAYSLTRYVIGADNPNTVDGKIYQPLEQESTTTPTSPAIPIGCAMDTIESLQSFLSCLGAK
jgi:hypothetical protein